MVFASPIFLFLFLPLTLAAYFTLPRAWRNGVLLVASLAFYAWGEAPYLALVLGSVAFNFAIGAAIGRSAEPLVRKRWLVAAVAGNLAALALFKYANFAVANVNTLAPILAITPVALATIPLPLGISFFTFHAISYVVDVYKGNAHAERNLPRFALYILLFPQLIAGPIIRWRDIARQLPVREERVADVAYGVRRFVLGLGKKVLIANTLGAVADRIFALPAGELTTPLAWLGLVCYTLQIYFDFSGYSDMAIGLMRMFGFRILENFNYPYVARSIREFWRRWHISLSNWFRDYLYIPLGGNQRGERRAYANLVIVFLLCGLWHGASWPFVLWGAWHGLFLVAERAGIDRALRRIGPLSHAYALLAVMGGWVLFRCETLAQAIAYYAALLGHAHGDPVRHPLREFLDPFVAFTLVVGVVFATPLARAVGRWRDRHASAAMLALDVAWLAAVFVLATAFLAAGTYNPFIYFRF
jgi:alginate O-acetyltransferase complex protein AlgI